MRVLAIDPGKASGIALLDYDRTAPPADAVTLVHTAELNESATGDYINSVLTAASAEEMDVRVVLENFFITRGTADKGAGHWSLYLIGVARWLTHAHGYTLPTLQTPGAAKAFAPNPRLRALGLWHVGGEGHALDALRHGALYLAERHRWAPPALLDY